MNLRSSYGIAKVSGAAFCLASVLVMAFYAGPGLTPLSHHRAFTSHARGSGAHASTSKAAWIIGTFLMVINNIAWSLTAVWQVDRNIVFSSPLSDHYYKIVHPKDFITAGLNRTDVDSRHYHWVTLRINILNMNQCLREQHPHIIFSSPSSPFLFIPLPSPSLPPTPLLTSSPPPVPSPTAHP